MGQSHDEDSGKAALEIRFAFAAAALCDAGRLPKLYSGGTWQSWRQTFPVNSLFVTCFQSKATAAIWVCSPVLSPPSPDSHWPCLSWRMASLLFSLLLACCPFSRSREVKLMA